VSFIARVGRDEHGEAIVQNLARYGLNIDGIVRDNDHPSGTALIMVDWMGRNMIAVAPGSNAYLTADDVHGMERRIAEARTMLVQLEIPIETVAATLAMAKGHGLCTILDPAPARPLPNEILRLVDILTPNEVEAELLTGYAAGDERGAGRAARELLDRGCGEVLVTLGARGVLWARHDVVELLPPLPVVAVDSTAAGDAFSGALGCALAEGLAMRRRSALPRQPVPLP
jgi:ribokinase